MRKNGVFSKSDRCETQVESYHFGEGRYNSMPEVNPAQVVIMGLVTVFIARFASSSSLCCWEKS